MKEIKDRLGNYNYIFFKNLQNYLETKLYFYGSIKRVDFFKESSDIDIVIICDNVQSVLFKCNQYLNIDKNKTQKIFQQHRISDKKIITGYKIKYKNKDYNLKFDLLIYDIKYKKEVMNIIDEVNNLPFYMLIILYIVKSLYYKFHFLTKSNYLYLKSMCFFSYFNKKINYNYSKEYTQLIMIDNFNI
jgi:predicted nucleotidyltransferase